MELKHMVIKMRILESEWLGVTLSFHEWLLLEIVTQLRQSRFPHLYHERANGAYLRKILLGLNEKVHK